MQFGGGWAFTSKPRDPIQKTFILDFTTMVYFKNALGNPDAGIWPEVNALRLEIFYETHQLYEPFIYNHPVWGQQVVRFAEPLPPMKGIAKGNGAVEPFSIKLIQAQPQ
jgi:hypothetical protein